MNKLIVFAFFFVMLGSCVKAQHSGDNQPTKLPTLKAGEAVATFAAGCFWATESEFEALKGVRIAVTGYSGGKTKNPEYEEVGSGETGHAESVQIYYDPKVISYDELLDGFFSGHDPTTLNRQGPDAGTQYRSAIFYRSPEEKTAIEAAMLRAIGHYKNKIVTQIAPFSAFYPAENYHQNYCNLHPDQPYVAQVSIPKIEKFKKAMVGKLK